MHHFSFIQLCHPPYAEPVHHRGRAAALLGLVQCQRVPQQKTNVLMCSLGYPKLNVVLRAQRKVEGTEGIRGLGVDRHSS